MERYSWLMKLLGLGRKGKRVEGAVRASGEAAETGVKVAEGTNAALGGADTAYHYTFREFAELIKKKGLKPGTYATPEGGLSPLQAQIDLALSPNQGLRDALVRVDLAGLRRAGLQIPKITRVGRKFNMPGGGLEMRFPYRIPPKYIEVILK
jgi:hypothetical protein